LARTQHYIREALGAAEIQLEKDVLYSPAFRTLASKCLMNFQALALGFIPIKKCGAELPW